MTDVEAISREVLGDDVVTSVDVRHATNMDDEPVLLIRVVYDGALGTLQAKKMSSLTSRIWEEERSAGSNAFPVIDFVADGEFADTHAAE